MGHGNTAKARRRATIGLVLVSGLLALFAAGWAGRRAWQARRFDPAIARAAREYAIDPRLIREVIRRESRFQPDACGAAGERGLMQITEGAASEWFDAHGRARLSGEALSDPELNIRIGSWYLARALRRWADREDPLPYALAEYNAGRANALRWAETHDGAGAFVEAITFPGTRRYVETIETRYRRARRKPFP